MARRKKGDDAIDASPDWAPGLPSVATRLAALEEAFLLTEGRVVVMESGYKGPSVKPRLGDLIILLADL